MTNVLILHQNAYGMSMHRGYMEIWTDIWTSGLKKAPVIYTPWVKKNRTCNKMFINDPTIPETCYCTTLWNKCQKTSNSL